MPTTEREPQLIIRRDIVMNENNTPQQLAIPGEFFVDNDELLTDEEKKLFATLLSFNEPVSFLGLDYFLQILDWSIDPSEELSEQKPSETKSRKPEDFLETLRDLRESPSTTRTSWAIFTRKDPKNQPGSGVIPPIGPG